MAIEERGGVGAARPAERASSLFLVIGLAWAALTVVIEDPLRGWVVAGASLAAAVTATVAVRRDTSRSNPAWFFLAGAWLLVPAYVVWYPLAVAWDLAPTSPSIPDVLFVIAYALFLVGLTKIIGRRSATDRRIDVLDTLIVGVGLGVLVWVAFIGPYLDADDLTGPARVVAISYTLWNLLLLGAIVRMLVQGGISSRGDRLLAAWVVTQLTADVLYAIATLGGTFDVQGATVSLYPVSFVLFGAAMLDPTTISSRKVHRDGSMRGARRFVLVVPAALIAPVVLMVLGVRDRSVDVVIVSLLAGILFALVLWRVWLLFVDVEEHRRTQSKLTWSIEQERRRTLENQDLLASLSERQLLSDRLSRIQRKISTRAPLQEVLDAVTQGAVDLVAADCAALRLVDEDDPGYMVMVSSAGVDPAIAEEARRSPLGVGVGGRAIVTNRLCIEDADTGGRRSTSSFPAGDLQTALAAPVHLGSRAIGSLVVATHRADRRYSLAEQEALMAFAEHVSIAVNDARSVRAMNEALEQAVHQAMHDSLTGLPNRACFYDRAEQALKAAWRDGTATAVLLLDLDRFKEINDTLGHRYGDRVLRAIEPRLGPLLRASDTLARLGGDEFCVLLPDVSGLEDAIEVANRLTEALEEPLDVDGMTLVVEASCGVAVAPEDGDTADLLLQRADIAMYAAKRSHLRVSAYEDDLDGNTPERLALLGELRHAIAKEELVLHYQPQIDLATGAIEGAEALVRWEHPRRGLLAPDEFIPLAEETGFIHQLTTWVLDAALEQIRRWINEPGPGVGPDFTVAVNLSTHSLLDDCFATEVSVALDRAGIAPERLVLEITETTLMADPARAARVLNALAQRGVRFAIDDFGTGYSSLASLKDLPVHDLKIDKSFVCGMDEGSDDAVIVRSVIELGHTLGLRTIAEGAENPEILARLADLGCDSAQGYAVARPMTACELVRWIGSGGTAEPPRGDPGSGPYVQDHALDR